MGKYSSARTARTRRAASSRYSRSYRSRPNFGPILMILGGIALVGGLVALLIWASQPVEKIITVKDKAYQDEGFFGEDGWWLVADIHNLNGTTEEANYWWPDNGVFSKAETPVLWAELQPYTRYRVMVDPQDGFENISKILETGPPIPTGGH